MASTQVVTFSGSSYTYTNNTGKNVRFIISYCDINVTGNATVRLSCNGVTLSSFTTTPSNVGTYRFGKNAATYRELTSGLGNAAATVAANNALGPVTQSIGGASGAFAAPTEVYVGAGQSLSLIGSVPPGGTGSSTIVFNAMIVTES